MYYYNNRNISQEEITMAFVINDSCLACGACVDACPVGAVKEGDPIYTIDEAECLDCGACAGVCPVGAPVEK